MKTICIMCPIGCSLNIDEKNKTVNGNLCPRGKDYGLTEITTPKRILTTSIHSDKINIMLKTSNPIPKEKIFEIEEEINKNSEKMLKKCQKNAKIGDILLKNILNTKSDVVISGIFKE